MKKGHYLLVAVLGLATFGVMEWPHIREHRLMAKEVEVDAMTSASRPTAQAILERALQNKAQDQLLVVVGWVTEILPDEQRDVVSYQRFVVRLTNRKPLLIEHNLQIAPRVEGLKTGSELLIRGRYFWNEQGGVLRQTHHDPEQKQPDGWIRFKHKNYG